jgi:hypothetical protein
MVAGGGFEPPTFVPQVYEISEIVMIKFWYDPSWPEPHLRGDLVLGEWSIKMALQIGWSAGDRIVRVDVMPLASC